MWWNWLYLVWSAFEPNLLSAPPSFRSKLPVDELAFFHHIFHPPNERFCLNFTKRSCSTRYPLQLLFFEFSLIPLRSLGILAQIWMSEKFSKLRKISLFLSADFLGHQPSYTTFLTLQMNDFS
ncbi:hypothetical protein ACH5RR_031283 [Cinchona calisaya]|uniref:Maturase K n=1 Tax=Cinchona calisaya TaxID=153742 RepID=A0ABD2YGR2_9GENT